MKKSYSLYAAAICSIAILSSCGAVAQSGAATSTTQTTTPTTTSTTTAGQTTQTVQTTKSGQSQTGSIMDVLSGVGNILTKTLGITTTDIVGTWSYQSPAVLFESDDVLTKAGGQAVAQKMEKTLDTYYQKVGIAPGKMTMTFDKDGNFTQSISGKTMSGTYTLENGNVSLKYSGGMDQIIGTTQFDGNDLVVVVDVSKILSAIKTISGYTNNATIQSLATIANGVSGMKTGFRFTK
ncbi:MAG: DUF4923 family protein [Bacteroidales bacterium]|nr:DUF4923 family protein [Bacteroidales bacterium]